jgi:inner membrane protein
VLGACIGEAIAGKQLGKKAMLIGAAAQSLPDIDFVAALWNDPAEYLLAHRGFTHSILFALLAVVLGTLLAQRVSKKKQLPSAMWVFLFGSELGAHLLLDVFNNYGVGLFEPFSHGRISLNALFVVDPFFSIWPLLSSLVLLVLTRHHFRRSFWWKFGIFIPLAYLMYCVFNKQSIDSSVRRSLAFERIHYTTYMTTPTPLNNWLWYAVAMRKDSFFVGFRSVFDSRYTKFEGFPVNDSLLQPMKDDDEVQHLIRFSQGFYSAEKWNDTTVFNDLRFGQIVGWHNPRDKFVFHYFLRQPGNRLVVQRGRFAKWDRTTITSMIRRIKGN